MKSVNKINLNFLKLKPGGKVLDIGCSYGEQAMEIAKQGLQVYGIDSSKELVSQFKLAAKKQKLNCVPIVGDATKMPYKQNQFNAVVATEIFEHIPNPQKAIEESYRVLIPGGRICVSVPTKLTEQIFNFLHSHWVEDSGHINTFSEKEISSLLKQANFKIEKVEYLNFEWSLFWLIHSLFKTRFDSTGSPLENEHISQLIQKFWHYLFKLRVGKYLIWFGNNFLPKSYYIYAVK